jgi:HAD superfamily 5'-nucleotidase-like hydrolase
MKFNQADVICFDVDYTLVKYTSRYFISLQFESLARLLIKHGAPEELLTIIPPSDFLKLGASCLVADFNTGFLLKLASDDSILRAYHGLTLVQDPSSIYGAPARYSMKNIEKYYIEGERWIFLTHFSIGAVLAWIASVELMKQGKFSIESYEKLASLIHEIANLNYGSNSDSEFYPEFYANPEKFILKASDQLKNGLAQLKQNGKKLAIVTNGGGEYANFIMNYAFGPEWHSLFEAYVFSAGKPEFFYHENELETIEHLQLDGEVFKKGSSKNLKEKVGGHHYVFVGDHYLSDVHGAKQFEWMTVALVEEIFYEKGICELRDKEFIENSLMNPPDGDILDYFQFWGSHFVEDGKRTFWWDFITNHADAIVPSIEKLIELFD